LSALFTALTFYAVAFIWEDKVDEIINLTFVSVIVILICSVVVPLASMYHSTHFAETGSQAVLEAKFGDDYETLDSGVNYKGSDGVIYTFDTVYGVDFKTTTLEEVK
jgi:hypothetical protein